MRACMTDRLFEPSCDALGRRVLKVDESVEPNVVTRYIYDGQNVVAEYRVQATTHMRERYYVNGSTYIDERVVMHTDGINKDFAYLLKDLYTVAGLADSRGLLVESYDYDAYGKVTMQRVAVMPYAADFDGDGDVDYDDLAIFKGCQHGSGDEPNGVGGWIADLDSDGDVDGDDYVLFALAYNGSDKAPRGAPALKVSVGSMVVSRVGNPFFFTGRRLDVIDKQDAGTPHHFTDDYAGLQLYDYRARTSLPDWGRFGQRDPLEYIDGMGVYEYAGSAPSVYADPSGLEACYYFWMDVVAHKVANFKTKLLDPDARNWIQYVTQSRMDPAVTNEIDNYRKKNGYPKKKVKDTCKDPCKKCKWGPWKNGFNWASVHKTVFLAPTWGGLSYEVLPTSTDAMVQVDMDVRVLIQTKTRAGTCQ